MDLDGAILAKNSYMGSFLTLLIVMTTMMFFYSKTITIMNKTDVDIFGALEENATD